MEEGIRILGLDLSAGATGVAYPDGDVAVFTPESTVPLTRLSMFRGWIHDLCVGWEPHMAVIENYAFGAKFARESLAEIHGVVRLGLYDKQVPFALVAPTQLKKFATGNGGAGKDEMVGEGARAGCPSNNNNAVDAWWLRQMALQKFGLPGMIPFLAKAQADVVNKIEWPMRFKPWSERD